MDPALLVKALGALFAIMNPFVALPMFLTLTTGYELGRQRSTAVRVAAYSAVMGAIIMLAGTAILGFFGVKVDDFRVAGGLVLLLIALGMLNGKNSAHSGSTHEQAQQQATQTSETDVSFYPLTFPMILGPGTITTLIVLSGQGKGSAGYVAVGVALAVVLAVLFVVLWFAPTIGHRMSHTMQVIMTRLMGMILAAIAVQMIIAGLTNLIPALGH